MTLMTMMMILPLGMTSPMRTVFSFIGGFHHASLHVQKVSFIAKNIVDGLHHHWTIKRHGTRCAGEIAASANNSACGIGVAYEAGIGGIRMLDGDVTDSVEADSLSRNRDHIDIYSASWGPDDDGKTVDGPASLARKAFRDGVTKGRGGKGSVFIWASGNGGGYHDNCNCDGYTNSIYTLSVSSATEKGNVPWYSEGCSSTLVTTYSSGGHEERQITTTDLRRGCTSLHTGTSASAPLAAGIVALTLQANKRLTWRDVQYISVLGASPIGLQANDWITNGAGRKVSHHFGFGMMNAGKMVDMALNWTNIPEQHVCEVSSVDRNVLIMPKETKTLHLTTAGCRMTDREVVYLEHVQAKITLTSSWRGDLQIWLISPSGTRSTLLTARVHDDSRMGFNEWGFLTTHMWGEKSQGEWTLEIVNGYRAGKRAKLNSWSLVMYGTSTHPLNTKPPSTITPPTTTPTTTSTTTTTTKATSVKVTTKHINLIPTTLVPTIAVPTTIAPNTTAISTLTTTALTSTIAAKKVAAANPKSKSSTTTRKVTETSATTINSQSVRPSTSPSPFMKTVKTQVTTPESYRTSIKTSAVKVKPTTDSNNWLNLPETSLFTKKIFLQPKKTTPTSNSVHDNVKAGIWCPAKTFHLRDRCIRRCPDGYYVQTKSNRQKICKACHYTCAACSGAHNSSCTECFFGWQWHGGICANQEETSVQAGASKSKSISSLGIRSIVYGGVSTVVILLIVLFSLLVYYKYHQCQVAQRHSPHIVTQTNNARTTLATYIPVNRTEILTGSKHSSQEELMESEEEVCSQNRSASGVTAVTLAALPSQFTYNSNLPCGQPV
ncbi:Fur1 [Bugula neritina]|uniref:Fur1 n=1 Tax=Bugula neritina TaxID=10212 RepID=A0A7J7JXC0_BUGNE|nr:Fur1 [Bugula neritina]